MTLNKLLKKVKIYQIEKNFLQSFFVPEIVLKRALDSVELGNNYLAGSIMKPLVLRAMEIGIVFVQMYCRLKGSE